MNLQDNELLLRPIEIEDIDFLRDMINDPEMERYVVGWSRPVSRHKQEEWIRSENSGNHIRYVIDCNGTPIGMASLTELDFKNATAELNIKLASTQWKKHGYGTRALRLLIAYAFQELNINCLSASILEYNAASIALFEKLGFQREGILRERVFKGNAYHSLYVYSLLKKEFRHA